ACVQHAHREYAPPENASECAPTVRPSAESFLIYSGSTAVWNFEIGSSHSRAATKVTHMCLRIVAHADCYAWWNARASLVAAPLKRALPTKRRARSHRDFLLELINFLAVSQSLAPAAKGVCFQSTKIICESPIACSIGIKTDAQGRKYMLSARSLAVGVSTLGLVVAMATVGYAVDIAKVKLYPDKKGTVADLQPMSKFCGTKPIKVALADGWGGNYWRHITRAEFE